MKTFEPEPGGDHTEMSHAQPHLPGRRSSRLAIVAVALTMLVLVGGVAAVIRLGQSGSLRSHQVAAGASPTESGSNPALESTWPVPSAALPTDAGTPPPSAEPTAAASVRPTGHTTVPEPPRLTPTLTCNPKGFIQMGKIVGLTGDATVILITDVIPSQRLCPGVRVRVFWASYLTDADGSSHLIGSAIDWIDTTHTSVAMHVTLASDQCKNPWFVARGDDPIPNVLPAGVFPFAQPLNYNYPPKEPGCH